MAARSPRPFVAWYGPVFWPYAYSDVFDYAFWPYGYDEGFWAYAYDDFFDGVFWGEAGPPEDYVSLVTPVPAKDAGPRLCARDQRPSYASVPVTVPATGQRYHRLAICRYRAKGRPECRSTAIARRCAQGE